MKIDVDLAVKLFKFLVPIDDPWRLSVGFAVLFLTINTCASRGWFEVIGLSAQASAESVTELRLEQTEMRIEQLDGQIENAVKAHCLAPTGEAKSYYYGKLKELKKKWYQAAPLEKYEQPTCRELGVREIQVGEP